MDDHDNIRLLAVVGSLRAGSYNRALLRAALEEAPPGIVWDAFDVRILPFYDPDMDGENAPEEVVAFRDAIRDADALLVVTPEYNRGLPGVVKNALDWASRPPMASPLAGKPVIGMGASTGMSGTAKAQEQLAQTVGFPGARMVEGAQVRVPEAYMKFDEHGELADDETREQIRHALERVRAEIAEPELVAA